ncbi:MAG: protein kinase [Pseudomonadota bacterium]
MTAFALPQVGELLADKYRVLRVVADGGMGIVFEAHHELLGKNVALKFPLPELAHVPSIVERFLVEARLCARIENEHVVRVLDVSKFSDLPYIVMELVIGVSLASQMGSHWPPGKAVAFAVQILEGLEAVHALGVVHRDVKPANVLVVESARGPVLKLIDFGIAKDSLAREALKRLTHAGALLGTPAYMAPEQIRDPLHAGASVDLYSAAVVLFELLAGTSPFTSQNPEGLAMQAVTGQVRPLLELVPDLPAPLVAIVQRGMALDVGQRFQSASEFVQALLPFADSAFSGITQAQAFNRRSDHGLHPTALATPFVAPPRATEYAEPPGVTQYAEPPRAFVPASAVASSPSNAARTWAIAALTLIAVGAVTVTALALRAHAKASPDAPLLVESAPPETVIAPLATEAPDPSASAAASKPVHAITPPPAPPPPLVKSPSAEVINETVAAREGRFARCAQDPQATSITLELHVAANGSVDSATPEASSASPGATECVAAAARSLEFPPHQGADQVARVTIPLAAAVSEPPRERQRRRNPEFPGRERRTRQLDE